MLKFLLSLREGKIKKRIEKLFLMLKLYRRIAIGYDEFDILSNSHKKIPVEKFAAVSYNEHMDSSVQRRRKMSERRKLQELTIKDNFMFGAVMVDEELCREFLEPCKVSEICKGRTW